MSNAHVADWNLIRQDYELAVDSVVKIAKRWQVSETAICQRAARHGWVRDPAARARIIAERDAKLAEKAGMYRGEVIAVTATMQSKVLTEHRKDIDRARKLVSSLLNELSDMTQHKSTFEELGELMHAPDDRGVDRLNKVYHKIISLPERVSSLNVLSSALKTLIMLERQAFNIEGALVDPEATKDTAEVVKGLDAIMDKFNQVLAIQAGPAPEPEIIIDVSRSTEAPATDSTV